MTDQNLAKQVAILDRHVRQIEATCDTLLAMMTTVLGTDVTNHAIGLVAKSHNKAYEEAVMRKAAADLDDTTEQDPTDD